MRFSLLDSPVATQGKSSRVTLVNTPYVQARDISAHIKDAVTFLIKNPDVILPKDKVRDIGTQRLFSSTPTSRIFHAIVSADKLNNFLFLDYSGITGRGLSVPELLTSDDLCIDGASITTVPVPALAQKIWINVTPILGKRDAYNDSLFFTDLGQLANLVTRAALCQAYNDTNNWITIRQQLLLLEMYAVIMAQVITNTYRLDPVERRLIMTIFAYYYAQMVGSQESSYEKMPPILMRCNFLGSGSDIIGIAEELQKYKENGILTINGMIKAIQTMGPARMKKYNLQVMFRSIASASVDSSTMIISMSYPPYFLYQLLRIASGYKNPIISGVVKAIGLKRKLEELSDDVADNPNLIGAIRR